MADNAPTVVTGAKEFSAISGNSGVVVGDLSGHAQTIGSQTNNHYHAARSESPPRPWANIPFRRDNDFVARGSLLDQIQEQISALASVALVGLGGVGKSQLAIEYCHRTTERAPGTWIFWVHASNHARLEQGFRDIADQVKLRDRHDAQADVFKLVHDWLCKKKNGPWLLVVDNADDAAVLRPPSSSSQTTQLDSDSRSRGLRKRLAGYLPSSKHGSVLVTSRTMHAARELVEENEVIKVEAMHPEAAHALLRQKLGDNMDSDDIRELAMVLEYMPLALVQAGAYIRRRTPRYSVRQFLADYRKSDMEKSSLLNQEAGHLRRDEEAKNSIIITWQISFDHVRSMRQSAADLLSLMSFFDRQGIPEALLHYEHKSLDGEGDRKGEGGGEETDESDSIPRSTLDDNFENDINTLRDYSFIKVTSDGSTFEMHSLVQLATRKWLESQGQLDRWREQFIANLSAEFPYGEFEKWGTCQVLFPHAKMALVQQPKSEESRKSWAILLYNAASYAWRRGRLDEAEQMSEMSFNVFLELFGTDDPDTLTSMALVGLVIADRGRLKEAEKLQVQVMETRGRLLGKEHTDTLYSIHNLALTYSNQGRWKEAEKLQAQVMETRERLLGKEHPDTLYSIHNLASTYSNQGRWQEAEKLQVQVMETTERLLGKEHPDTLNSIHNLASTYSNQGRWQEAEKLQVQVLEERRRVQGEEHAETLASMNNLAVTYTDQGRWEEAEKLHVQVLEGRRKVLGEEHVDMLTSIDNLAAMYANQGRWKEAEKLQVQVLEVKRRVLGEEHTETLTSMSNLALTYTHQGRWKEAEKLQVQALEGRRRVLGEEHPHTLTSMSNLAFTFKDQGKDDIAIALMERVVELREHVLGLQHPDFISSLDWLNEWKKEKDKSSGNSRSTVQSRALFSKKRLLLLFKERRERGSE